MIALVFLLLATCSYPININSCSHNGIQDYTSLQKHLRGNIHSQINKAETILNLILGFQSLGSQEMQYTVKVQELLSIPDFYKFGFDTIARCFQMDSGALSPSQNQCKFNKSLGFKIFQSYQNQKHISAEMINLYTELVSIYKPKVQLALQQCMGSKYLIYLKQRASPQYLFNKQQPIPVDQPIEQSVQKMKRSSELLLSCKMFEKHYFLAEATKKKLIPEIKQLNQKLKHQSNRLKQEVDKIIRNTSTRSLKETLNKIRLVRSSIKKADEQRFQYDERKIQPQFDVKVYYQIVNDQFIKIAIKDLSKLIDQIQRRLEEILKLKKTSKQFIFLKTIEQALNPSVTLKQGVLLGERNKVSDNKWIQYCYQIFSYLQSILSPRDIKKVIVPINVEN